MASEPIDRLLNKQESQFLQATYGRLNRPKMLDEQLAYARRNAQRGQRPNSAEHTQKTL